MNTDPLYYRTMSGFPLSIATGLAFESIFQTTEPVFDLTREVPEHINLSNYQEFYINISTLFRNLMGSLGKEDAARVNSLQLKEALMGEIEVIQSLGLNEGSGRTKIIFYVCEYKKLESKANKFVVVRRDETTNQKIYRELHNQTVKLILAELGESDTLRVFDSELATIVKGAKTTMQIKTTALVLTHIAYDLLSYKHFTTLDLIESHTGKLKKRHEWYTKYLNGKELNMFPFTEGLLCVFGDSESFRPMDFRLRKELVELAKANRWSPATSREKIRSNLDQLKNPYYKDVLKTIL